MPAGRPLEPVGDDRPRWMAAGPLRWVTEPGVQVDSSVAYLLGWVLAVLTWVYGLTSMVDSGQHRSSSDAPETP